MSGEPVASLRRGAGHRLQRLDVVEVVLDGGGAGQAGPGPALQRVHLQRLVDIIRLPANISQDKFSIPQIVLT